MFEKVAESSFYDQLSFTKTDNGWIENDNYVSEIDVYWTYENGINYQHSYSQAVDTGFMSDYMSFTSPDHIEYHFGDFLESLPIGADVEFQYQIIDQLGCDDCEDIDNCDCDLVVGWILVCGTYS